MDTDDTDDKRLELERIAMIEEVLDAIGNRKRLATLEKVTQGVPASDIHEEVDASRSGVNRFISDFKDTDLVQQAQDGLRLTAKGAVVVDLLNELDEVFEEFERERVRDIINQSSLSQEDVLRELVQGSGMDREEIAELLEEDEDQ